MRSDKRAADELRSTTLTPNFMPQAEGSVLIEAGRTKVICTASVEDRVPPFLRNSGKGWVTAEYGMLPRATSTRTQREATAGKVGGRTQEIQRLIGRSLRAVTDPTIPMNEGCFRPVTVFVPEGTLLNPRRPAPVGGGNVETSTRNADVVLQALALAAPDRVPANSGGTMSNVMLGGDDWAFYETNGCGMGARPNADGLDGIQCHMTNTLNTPIEAIERDYPMLVTRYEFAPGTGGAGRYRGGDGLVRGLRLTHGTAHATLLADRHTVAPAGARGGESGACGAHTLVRADGTREALPGKCSRAWHAGETLEIQTPGGGGYGLAEGAGEG